MAQPCAPGEKVTVHLGPVSLPILTQGLEKTPGEHGVTIDVTFSTPDEDHHALGVDLLRQQPARLADPQAPGIHGHQNCTVLDLADSLEQ